MKEIKNLSYIELTLMIIFAAYAILPDFSLIPDIAYLGITLAYFLFVATRRSSYSYPNSVCKYILISFFLTILYFALTDTLTIGQNVSNRVMKILFAKFNQFSCQLMPFAIMYRLLSNASSKQQRIFLIFTAFFFGVTLVSTYAFINTNPGAIRSFHNTEFDASELKGLGNFYFVYGAAALIPSLGLIIMRFKDKRIRIASVFSIAFLYSFLLKAQFSLALLIPSICLLYLYYLTLPINKRKNFLFFLPIVVIILPYVFLFVANFVGEDNDIHDRFMELYYTMTFQDSNNTAQDGADRMAIYGKTIMAFLSSPIWGTKVNFDPHSTFLSVLADVGIIGAIPYFLLFYSMSKNIYRYLNIEQNKYSFKVSLLFIVLMGLTNPILSTSALQFVVWCIAPLIINEITKSISLKYEKVSY